MSPTECDNGEKGKAVHLIVVSTVHRQELLGLAYDLPMSGYFVIRKMYNRILQHFYWPGFKKDVTKWCKVCHTGSLKETQSNWSPPCILVLKHDLGF